MAKKMSKGRVSKSLNDEEVEKMLKIKAMDELELRKLTRETRMVKELKMKDLMTEKQTKVMSILRKENNNLLDNLKLIKSTQRCIMDVKQTQDIANLFAQGDDLDAAIAQEKRYIKDLESQIQKESKNLLIMNKNKGKAAISSDFLLKKENERADRTLESWKSKLSAEQTQLAMTTKENEEMRQKLNSLLKEKAQFNKLFEELMVKLKKGKRIMTDVVDASRQEFQKRDEVHRKIEALKSRDKADLARRMEEMQDLEKRLYEDKRLVLFRHRVQKVRERPEFGVRRSSKKSLEQEKLNARFEKTKEFWDQLKENTGLDTAEEICDCIRSEDANLFSLFNFNNEIRDQLEVLTYKNVGLVKTADEEQTLAEECVEQEIKLRNSMTKKLSGLEQANNDLNDVCDANARLFSRLLDKIMGLFKLVKCKTEPLEQLLGNNKEVTEYNFRLYLCLVETEVINCLESLTGQAVNVKQSVKKSLSAVRSNKSLKAKSTKSVVFVDKKVITRTCWECEGTKPVFL